MNTDPIQTTQYAEPDAVSVGEWMIAYLLQIIPIVGIVMLFIWAFGEGTKPSKANWAKATLIWFGISLLLGGCFFVATVLLAGGLGNSNY